MRFAILSLLGSMLIAGCGGRKDFAPVSGVVTLDGQPLAGATVTLSPLDSKQKDAPTSVGKTDENGRFVLKTVNGSKGALIGKHRVTITKSQQVDDADDSIVAPKDEVPAEWNSDSQKTFEVPDGGTADANFEITTPRKK